MDGKRAHRKGRTRWVGALGVLAACGGEAHLPPRPDAGLDAAPDAEAEAGAAADAGPDAGADAGPPPPVEDEWCARLAAGPGGTRDFVVDLSAAHADVRFFGPSDDYDVADEALAATLAEPAALAEPALAALALAQVDVCAASADARPVAAVRVEAMGSVALITPGTGEVVLPEGTTAVAIDLREVPAWPGLAPMLEEAVAPALAATLERPTHRIRRYGGLPDEVFAGRDNVYGRGIEPVRVRQIRGRAAQDLPIAFLVGERLAPEAAEIAGALRLQGRAWIFGRDVPAAVAEARWTGVGAAGLAPRVADLFWQGRRWPDEVPADRALDGPLDEVLSDLPALGDPAAPDELDEGVRARMSAAPVDVPFRRDARLGLGEARAALLVVHGAARLFFPYFHVVGDVLDERLLEVIETLDAGDPADRRFVRDLLRRLGHALQDGHQFVSDWAADVRGVPFNVDHVDGLPVVVRSLSDDVLVGDTVVGIDGVPVADWYATELARTSAATLGYRLDLASSIWRTRTDAVSLDLLGLDGATRSVVVDPVPFERLGGLGFAPVQREEGFCDDLGAPEVYYLNLGGDVITTVRQLRNALEEAAGATGLVLDMRGYPVIDHYEAASRLVPEPFSSPVFRVPSRGDPTRVVVDESHYDLAPLEDPSYAGPIALLVGPVTVSAAENFSMMLVGAGRVTVVGRRSAGTNGNITGVQTPGGFSFTFTGMEVLYPDRSLFHGVGIVPDVEVAATAADYFNGDDPVLQAGIEVVQ